MGKDEEKAPDGKGYVFDCRGFLVDPAAWNPELRDQLAQQENILLGEDHLMVIRFLRRYYAENEVHPVIRTITTAMTETLGAEKGSIQYFHTLFPVGINQAYRIAGLPVKHSCC